MIYSGSLNMKNQVLLILTLSILTNAAYADSPCNQSEIYLYNNTADPVEMYVGVSAGTPSSQDVQVAGQGSTSLMVSSANGTNGDVDGVVKVIGKTGRLVIFNFEMISKQPVQKCDTSVFDLYFSPGTSATVEPYSTAPASIVITLSEG